MSIVTLNEVAGCQGDPYSWKVLALLLSTRESLSIFWTLKFTFLFQYCPSILVIWELVWKWKLLKMCLYCQEDFHHCFWLPAGLQPLSWAGMFILTENEEITLRTGYIPHALCNFNCDVILAVFLSFTHECILEYVR